MSLQIRRRVEGARLECHFATFGKAKQVSGSFSGNSKPVVHVFGR